MGEGERGCQSPSYNLNITDEFIEEY